MFSLFGCSLFLLLCVYFQVPSLMGVDLQGSYVLQVFSDQPVQLSEMPQSQIRTWTTVVWWYLLVVVLVACTRYLYCRSQLSKLMLESSFCFIFLFYGFDLRLRIPINTPCWMFFCHRHHPWQLDGKPKRRLPHEHGLEKKPEIHAENQRGPTQVSEGWWYIYYIHGGTTTLCNVEHRSKCTKPGPGHVGVCS